MDHETMDSPLQQVTSHSSLGPGIPDPSVQTAEPLINRHCIPQDHRIAVVPILGGLHHEYQLQKIAAWECQRNPSSIGSCFCGRQPVIL